MVPETQSETQSEEETDGMSDAQDPDRTLDGHAGPANRSLTKDVPITRNHSTATSPAHLRPSVSNTRTFDLNRQLEHLRQAKNQETTKRAELEQERVGLVEARNALAADKQWLIAECGRLNQIIVQERALADTLRDDVGRLQEALDSSGGDREGASDGGAVERRDGTIMEATIPEPPDGRSSPPWLMDGTEEDTYEDAREYARDTSSGDYDADPFTRGRHHMHSVLNRFAPEARKGPFLALVNQNGIKITQLSQQLHQSQSDNTRLTAALAVEREKADFSTKGWIRARAALEGIDEPSSSTQNEPTTALNPRSTVQEECCSAFAARRIIRDGSGKRRVFVPSSQSASEHRIL
ncbi:hypothetical protein CF336_g6244 [Tilletia laevis]|nr:hypothetical protein CF336_g6244 [Tilletia laevis]